MHGHQSGLRVGTPLRYSSRNSFPIKALRSSTGRQNLKTKIQYRDSLHHTDYTSKNHSCQNPEQRVMYIH